jgi:hypothetical protein
VCENITHVAEVVGRRLFTAKARVGSQGSPLRFVVGRATRGLLAFEDFGFALSIISRILPAHAYVILGTNSGLIRG